MTDQRRSEQNVSTVKVGIAGLGRAGWGIHVEALSEMTERFEIVAVSDPDESRQREATARLSCRTYGDTAELIGDDDVELLVMATPSQYHCTDSITAMRTGRHVLTEKPMAPSLAEVDEMIAVAHETGQLLTVNQNYRYTSNFMKVKEVIDSGVLGRIIQIRFVVESFKRRWDWQTLKAYGGGILNNQGAHMVDLALQIIDDPEPDVFAYMETNTLYAGDAESHAKVILRPETGPLIDIELTHANAFPQASVLVMGTQGTLVKEPGLIRWRYFKPEEAPPLILDTKPTPDRTYNSETLPMYEESFQFDRDFIASVRRLYQELYMTLRSGAPLGVTPESVRRQVAILERCRELSPV